jgi:hypothetical protein
MRWIQRIGTAVVCLAMACDQPRTETLQQERQALAILMLPSDARAMEQGEPEYSTWSHTIEWRFRTDDSAATYRASVLGKLRSRYRCTQQRKRVLCHRAITTGDLAWLDLRVTPSLGSTLVKARLVMSPR